MVHIYIYTYYNALYMCFVLILLSLVSGRNIEVKHVAGINNDNDNLNMCTSQAPRSRGIRKSVKNYIYIYILGFLINV